MLWIWTGRIPFPPFLSGEFVTFGSGCGSWAVGRRGKTVLFVTNLRNTQLFATEFFGFWWVRLKQMLERIGVGELVLLNFQPIQIQMLQGFVFHLGRTGGKKNLVAGENLMMKQVRGRESRIVSGRRQSEGRENSNENSTMYILYIHTFVCTNILCIVTCHL